MKTIGITGGIGSGKTTVSKVFESLGIPVFYADEVASRLYESNSKLLSEIQNHFGQKVFQNGKVHRPTLASIVFSDPQELKFLNALIHPLVQNQFQIWKSQTTAPYVMREAAILIESGSYKDCDHIILVSASEEIRIQRVMKRNQLNADQVVSRMKNQLDESELRKHCDLEIINDESVFLLPQILHVHQFIMA